MFEWIRGLRRQSAPARKLRSRGDGGDAERVELAEFAPGILPFLGMTAYLQLELYEAATRAVSGAPTLEAKNVLANVAGQTLAKYQRLTQEIRDRGHEPHTLMAPYASVIDSYIERIETSDWHQHVLSLYLVGGLFDDFFASLATGLKDGFRAEAISILQSETGRGEVKALLEGELEADPALGSWLAIWGRRLVGDTLLVSRAVLTLSERREFDASEVEPVFTELIADHIRRMDALGLTA
ncbi:ferritin-like fold-containing protein [Leucobacter salsicius]|uniref:ferritin-like fold-containing protein n=1 Tax=Leucobacter salsicius TaxID=664638 RepID=UPI00034CA332|nr:ferritin-like fold-containing protein [Leucobacter salsicius]